MAFVPFPVKTENPGDVSVGIATGQSVGADQGSPSSEANAWFVKVTDGVGVAPVDPTNGLKVDAVFTASAPPTPTVERAQSLAVAAAGTANLDSTAITAGTKKLRKVVFSATGPARADLVKVENGVESSVLQTLLTTSAQPNAPLDIPDPAYVTIANSAGADNFRLKVTNIDQAGGDAIDTFATYYVQE